MMCCCEKCKFVFESIKLLDNCPDCGHGPVRNATGKETTEYAANRQVYGPMPVYGISNLYTVHEADTLMLISVNNGCPALKMSRPSAAAVLI